MPSVKVSAVVRVAIVALALTCGQSRAELAVPPLSGRLVDRAGMFAGADSARVEQAIMELEQATGGQLAVLTMPALNGDALEPFSMRVAEKWRIGHKGRDDGVLLLVVRDSREIRFEIGRGWEGAINDARAGDIIRGMQPYFRAGNFGDGTIYAVRRVQGFVTGKPPTGLPSPPAIPPGHGGDGAIHIGKLSIDPIWGFFALIVFIFAIGTLSDRRRHGRTYGGGYSGWSSGSSSSGGGGFSGGGASGSW